MEKETESLDNLVGALEGDLGRGVRGGEIARRLGEYASGRRADWRPFALFSEERYTRNLVARNGRFELLVLCWGVGQESPIHNHEGQDCWMAVLEGDVEELRYATPAEVRPGPLEPREAKVFGAGQVAYITDDIGLHLVRSAHPRRRAVSLHLYAAPYDACNTYCPDTGRVTRIQLTNHSVRGRLVAHGVG